MATQAYRDWVARGRPFRLATPVAEIKARARIAGVGFLGDLGNEAHLQAATPEDHTPFSATEWPVQLAEYIVCAIDLARGAWCDRLLADARAGRAPWLKYMNFGGKNYSRKRDGFATGTRSGDEHGHLSFMSDWVNRSIGDYNPFVAVPMQSQTRSQRMFFVMKDTSKGGDGTVWVSDGLRRRPIGWNEFLFMRDQLGLKMAIVSDDAAVESYGGMVDHEAPAVTAFTDDQAKLLADQVAANVDWLTIEAVETAAFKGAQRAETE